MGNIIRGRGNGPEPHHEDLENGEQPEDQETGEQSSWSQAVGRLWQQISPLVLQATQFLLRELFLLVVMALLNFVRDGIIELGCPKAVAQAVTWIITWIITWIVTRIVARSLPQSVDLTGWIERASSRKTVVLLAVASGLRLVLRTLPLDWQAIYIIQFAQIWLEKLQTFAITALLNALRDAVVDLTQAATQLLTRPITRPIANHV